MKEVLLMLLEGYADWEAALVAAAVNDNENDPAKYCVKTVGLTKQPVRSIGGFTTLPDYALDFLPADFAALMLIGARTWRSEAAKPVARLVEATVKRNILVGGICAGSGFLARHGFLNNVHHTGNSLEYLIETSGGNYTGEKFYIAQQAVYDKGIITANGTAHMEFAKEVLQALGSAPKEKIDEWYDYLKLGQYEADKKRGIKI